MTDTRRYTEREVATILRLAGRLDATGATAVTRAGDSTLTDIEDIAAAVGIDRAAVRAAAVALEQRQDKSIMSFLVGGATLFRIERTIPREIATADFGDLIGSVHWTMGGRPGEVTEAADAVTWQYQTEEGPATNVEIARRPGHTRIRVLAQHENPAGWTLLGTGAATVVTSGIAIAALEPGLVGSAIAIAGLATLNLLGARALWRRHVANVRRKLQELADRLEAQIRAG